GPVSILVHARDGALRWDGTALSGYQLLANRTRAYIYLEAGVTPVRTAVLRDGRLDDGNAAEGHDAALVLQFADDVRLLGLRYGISFSDAGQAEANPCREITGYHLAAVKQAGRDDWNKELAQSQVD